MNNRFTLIILCCLLLIPGSLTVASQDTSAGRLLAEINLARSQPHIYVNHLRQFRDTFQGKQCRVSGSSAVVQTCEGKAAVDEAIRYMLSRKALPPLTGSHGLTAAASELVMSQGRTGAVGHATHRNERVGKRVDRYGLWKRRVAENIVYSPADPRGMVMQLIIDDGVPGRGHRDNLFSRSFRKVGISCGPHPIFENVCVMDFADDFREHSQASIGNMAPDARN